MSLALFLQTVLSQHCITLGTCACILAFGNEEAQFSEGYSVKYLLTPWSRVLLEKLTGCQLDKKCPAFYGTRKFITAFVSACHQSLSTGYVFTVRSC
jgi:hypothetical protein